MSNKYKINIHSHSVFSDGSNSPIEMARECKRLGFSAYVVTDHYYGGRHPEMEITYEKKLSYNRALKEARTILPTIRGMEVAFGGEEFLLFGSTAINWLLSTHGLNTKEDVLKMKEEHNCALVLCHPQRRHTEWIEILDGYEEHNSGQNWFKNDREKGELINLQAWHNSDAHDKCMLDWTYNILDVEITTEEQLIDYIKSGKQHDFYCCREDKNESS